MYQQIWCDVLCYTWCSIMTVVMMNFYEWTDDDDWSESSTKRRSEQRRNVQQEKEEEKDMFRPADADVHLLLLPNLGKRHQEGPSIHSAGSSNNSCYFFFFRTLRPFITFYREILALIRRHMLLHNCFNPCNHYLFLLYNYYVDLWWSIRNR